MSKSKTTGVIVTVRIPREIVESVEALARLTIQSKDAIIRRAVETYMLYEGAGIFEEIRQRKRAAAGGAVDLSDIIAHLEEVVAHVED